MTPPSVLLDDSFLAVLADPTDHRFTAVAGCYSELLDQYERNEIRIRARADHLAVVPRDLRRTLFSPIESIHVADQFRRAAARLSAPVEIDPEMAVSLVVMRREGITRVATLDRRFDVVDVTVMP